MNKHRIRFQLEIQDARKPNRWYCDCGFVSESYEEQMKHQEKEIIIQERKLMCRVIGSDGYPAGIKTERSASPCQIRLNNA